MPLNRPPSSVRHINQSEISLHKIKAEKLPEINQFRHSIEAKIARQKITFVRTDCTCPHSKTHAMDDLNLYHILAQDIRDIGHGVRLCAQDDVHSGTLVCFLDRNGALHFGFGYRNGSNFRVVCWEGNPPRRRNKTVPKGGLIIAFDDETTPNSFRDNFNANNFGFTAAWFNNDAPNNVRDELRALNHKQDRIADLTARIAGLTIDQMDEVIQKIDELQGNK